MGTNLGLALRYCIGATINNGSQTYHNYYLNADNATDYAQFDYLFSGVRRNGVPIKTLSAS